MPDVEGSFRPRLPGYGPFLPNGAVVVPLSEALFVDPGTLVPAEDQNGTPGAPFTAIQTAVDALAAKVQGTIVLAPGVYPDEAINIGATKLTLFGLGSREIGVLAGGCTIAAVAELTLMNLAAIGSVSSTAEVSYYNTESFPGATCTALNLILVDSTVGTVTIDNGVFAQGSTLTNGGTAGGIQASNSDFQFGVTPWAINSGAVIRNSLWASDCLANSITFRDCDIAGAFTGSNFAAFNSDIGGGSVNVTVSIAVDLYTYSRVAPSFWTATNGVLIQGAPWTPGQEQIGWDASVVSSLFTVLVANNHAPGIYLVYAPLVVRTVAGAGTATRTISWNAPTIGAQTHVTAGIVLTTLGTKAQDPVLVVSDGLADVTVRYAPVGIAGAPVIDVYAASLQAGLNLF